VVVMRRGDIVLAGLDPAIGSEADKRRPVVIVSNDGANRAAEETGRGVIVVVPLTSNVATVHLFQVFIASGDSGLRADSKAQIEQIRALSVQRLTKHLGSLPEHLMGQIDQALRRQLDL
jgi:mRNA interferase MazF